MLDILLAVAIILGIVGVGLLICALSYRGGYVHGYMKGTIDLASGLSDFIKEISDS